MPSVLTESATAKCIHSGVIVPKASQAKLTVAGVAVLVSGDMSGKSTACVNAGTGIVKCAKVQSEIGVVATKLKVDGKGVLLEGSHGLTTGTVGGVPQTWSVSAAGQSKVQAK